MPQFRCDFDVKSDLVLSQPDGGLTFATASGYSLTLKNGPPDAANNAIGLAASVCGQAESMGNAEGELRKVLAEQLDLLASVTCSRYEIIAPRRLMEWEPGQMKREIRHFHVTDSRYPPIPDLDDQYLETVQHLDRASPPPYTRAALRFFRYGMVTRLPEDQFMQFWLALEIIAESIKNPTRLPITCPSCKAAWKCHSCDAEPTRVPMAKQAIENLIHRIVGATAPEVAKRQFAARNGLMHGRQVASIEKECKLPMDTIVNELAVIAWKAVLSTIPVVADAPLMFAHRDGQFTNMARRSSFIGTFDHHGDGPHPDESMLPKVEISLVAAPLAETLPNLPAG
jgi:hypothetical protein